MNTFNPPEWLAPKSIEVYPQWRLPGGMKYNYIEALPSVPLIYMAKDLASKPVCIPDSSTHCAANFICDPQNTPHSFRLRRIRDYMADNCRGSQLDHICVTKIISQEATPLATWGVADHVRGIRITLIYCVRVKFKYMQISYILFLFMWKILFKSFNTKCE